MPSPQLGTLSNVLCTLLPFCPCCKDSKKTYLIDHYSKIKSITIYDGELENVPEFNKFEDSLRSFDFHGFNENDKTPKVIATLKGNVHLCTKPSRNHLESREVSFPNIGSQIWPGIKSNDKCKIIVRLYILRANNLHPSDISGLSDPYVEILFGKFGRISDHKNYIPKTLNPVFGKCYEVEISFPECSTIQVRIMDYDRISKNDLIGETTIDIESRYYSRHRPHCGLQKQYDRDGYNKWRDVDKPSFILYKLCGLHSLKPPIYMKNSVQIGSKVFYIDDENAKTDKQSLALYVLNHWQEMPVVGYHLVPEHVETRTLYNPDMPNLHQGSLEMWIDMFTKGDVLPEKIDVKPPVIEQYELRLIVWSVTDVELVDDNYFTGQKHSDIYIKGWLPGLEPQSTDVHYRSLNGEGLFNWRFKFPFAYNKTENVMINKVKNIFAIDSEDQKYLPTLHLQILDSDPLSPDNYIGFLTLDLWNMPRGSKTPWWSTTSTKVPRMNLFKVKRTRGWWPLISRENNVNRIVGKIDTEIQILTKQDADNLPAGLGRDEPQGLPEPKRPSINFLSHITAPLTFLFGHFFRANKKRIVTYTFYIFVIVFVLLFIYAIPGYTVKKIMKV